MSKSDDTAAVYYTQDKEAAAATQKAPKTDEEVNKLVFGDNDTAKTQQEATAPIKQEEEDTIGSASMQATVGFRNRLTRAFPRQFASDEEELNMSPLQKLIKYKRIPWRLLIDSLLCILLVTLVCRLAKIMKYLFRLFCCH